MSLIRHDHRRGLATLEMVLALPILLMVMALIINYGTLACWKVRELTVARHVLWGSRWPRTGGSNPRPQYWPASASQGVGAADNMAELDDSRVDQPVARGPLPGAIVNRDLLDPTRGPRQGTAELTRSYPLLGKMGQYHLEANSQLLDDKWQYQRMGMGDNRQRRIPVIYALAKAPAGMASAYIRAVTAILNFPMRPQLRPLDKDDEFISYGMLFGWGGAPDFHPYLYQFCETDHRLADEAAGNTIDRIQGKVERDAEGNEILRIPSVAETMARAFIGLYQRVIRQYEARLDAIPPPSGGQAASMRADIARLKGKIEVLEQFLNTIRK